MQPRTLEALFWRSRGLMPTATAERMGVTVRSVESQIKTAREQLGLDVFKLDRLLATGGALIRVN